LLHLKDENVFKALLGYDPPTSTPICPNLGQMGFPNVMPEDHPCMTDLIDEAKKLRDELRQAEKAKRASERYVTGVKWRYGQLLAVIHAEAKSKGKGAWEKALAEIGDNRRRANEAIRIGKHFRSAEEASKCRVDRALKLIRKGAKGGEANAVEAGDRDGNADGPSPNNMEHRDDLKERYGVNYYCYATPSWLREAIASEYGFPALDVASSHDRHFGRKFYSPEQDGMKQDWVKGSKRGLVFLNPPYITTDRVSVPNGHLLDEWVEKALATSQAGCTVIVLLPLWRKYDWLHLVIKYAEVRLSAVPVVSEGFGPMAGRKCGNTNWYSEYETIVAIFRPNQEGFLGEWIHPIDTKDG
jgi:hypothetical protein